MRNLCWAGNSVAAGDQTSESFIWYLKWHKMLVSGQLNFMQCVDNLIHLIQKNKTKMRQTNFALKAPISLHRYKTGLWSISDVNIWYQVVQIPPRCFCKTGRWWRGIYEKSEVWKSIQHKMQQSICRSTYLHRTVLPFSHVLIWCNNIR